MDTPAPNSQEASLTRSLAVLRRLEWRVRHAVENVLSGEYRSTFRGRGMEFDQVVRYEYGDDVRDIDWNVTARLGEPYRKKFVEERESTLFVVVEDSPSLQFGSGSCSKRDALLELAGLVMLLGAVNRDRVGYLIARPGGYDLRPAVRGRGQIMHLASTLLGHQPPPLDAPEGQEARASIPWQLLSRAAPRHSIVLWLSDFAPGATPDGWAVMRRRYQTMGFRIDDPWDLELPRDTGLFAAFDPASRRLVSLEGSSAERRAHAEWRETRDGLFQGLFPDLTSRMAVSTAEDRLDALVSFFHRRMAGTRRG